MPGPRINPIRASLVPAGAADLIRFRVQQAVQGLFHARPHCLVNMAAQLAGINSNRILQALGCILLHGGGPWFWLGGCVVTTILPDRGHRLKMCANYGTSSNLNAKAFPREQIDNGEGSYFPA